MYFYLHLCIPGVLWALKSEHSMGLKLYLAQAKMNFTLRLKLSSYVKCAMSSPNVSLLYKSYLINVFCKQDRMQQDEIKPFFIMVYCVVYCWRSLDFAIIYLLWNIVNRNHLTIYIYIYIYIYNSIREIH